MADTDKSRFMETGMALEIVFHMAKRLYKEHGEFTPPAKCPADVDLALDTVEDFIVNNFEEDKDEANAHTVPQRLPA